MVATCSANKAQTQTKLEDFAAPSDGNTKKPSGSRGQKRKATATADNNGSSNADDQAQAKPRPRPSAANAEAIKGNTTVSPSLPEASKKRKPNVASLSPVARGDAGGEDGKRGKGRPKAELGGRNVGGEAKRAVQRQAHFAAGSKKEGAAGRGGGESESEGDKDDDWRGEEEDAEEKIGLKLDKPIMINRSPVLQLWGACVAHALYGEKVRWETCLSMAHGVFEDVFGPSRYLSFCLDGAAIAALCAVSKGKAIGMIKPQDETDKQAARKEDKKHKALQDIEEFHVMGFLLHVKGGKVQLSGAPKKVNEAQLIGKFGGQEHYYRAREAMEDALKNWQKHDEELNKKAFGMYEKFRATVPAGRQRLGEKGK